MKTLHHILTIVLFAALPLFLAPGCATKADLPVDGIYDGNTVLFNYEKTIPGAFKALDIFVKWEHDNRMFLQKYPAITQYADYIRENAPKWRSSAIALHAAYTASPNQDTAKQLDQILALIEGALAESAKYIAQNQTPKSAGT